MNIQTYLEQKKEIYSRLIRFIEGDNDVEENFQNLKSIIKNQKILNDRQEFRTFLHLIAKISNNHHRIPDFFGKIERILDYLKTDIKKYYSNDEIYQIFKSNKRILLFIIESKIMFIDKSIIYKMIKSKYIKMKYPQFFSPEIKQFFDQNGQIEYDYDFSKIEYLNEDDDQTKEFDLIKEINQELPEKFNEKRFKGENDDYLTELIRNDMIEDFIIYVEKQSYPLTSLITPSIYETNYYLLEKNPTLIEYCAFFGSSQIFKYLYKNGVELQSSLWNYAIHSDDPQMIHLLEENHINYHFDYCFIESIKCHHNDVANYIQFNFSEDQSKIHQNEKILSQIVRYYNFLYFPLKSQETSIFLFACGYDYLTLCKLFLATYKIDINSTVTNSIKNKIYKMEFLIYFF